MTNLFRSYGLLDWTTNFWVATKQTTKEDPEEDQDEGDDEDTKDEIWQVKDVTEEQYETTEPVPKQSVMSDEDTFFWLTNSDLLRIVVIFTSVSTSLTLCPYYPVLSREQETSPPS